MNETKTSLASALVQATQHAQSVSKDGKNAFHGYRYASAEAIIAEAREALTAAGLTLAALGWSVTPPAGDFPGHLTVSYRLFHVSGETLDLEPCSTAIIPEKGRPYDKAEATALTYSLGYVLRGLLLLPRVDEEPDKRDDRGTPPHGAREEKREAVDWEKAGPDFVARFEAAKDDRAIAEIAAMVHKATPPKAWREKIGAAYQAAVKRVTPVPSNGAAA